MSVHFRPTSGSHEDEKADESSRRAQHYYTSLSSTRPSHPPSAGEEEEQLLLRRYQERMAASMRDVPTTMRPPAGYHPPEFSAALPPSQSHPPLPATSSLRASAMASWPNHMDATTATTEQLSSAYAVRMAQAQRSSAASAAAIQQQMQAQAHSRRDAQQYQQLQHQQAELNAQREELEFKQRMLRDTRNIDDMWLSSGMSPTLTRRFPGPMGMDSIPPSATTLYGGAGSANQARRSSFLESQAAGRRQSAMHPTFFSSPPMMGDQSSALYSNRSTNISNQAAGLGQDPLQGKINRQYGASSEGYSAAGLWQDPSARRHSELGSQHSASSLGSALGTTLDPNNEAVDEANEEDDQTYFNETGTDEVDRDFKRSQENFPLKLYRIIYESVQDGKGDIISFAPHGRAFAVHKPKEFLAQIMPKYFGSGLMNTFLKQLNLYGFKRITEGRDKGGYFHPMFIRGRRPLCRQIRRKKTDSKPGSKTTGLSNQATPSKEGKRLSLPERQQPQRLEETKSVEREPSPIARHPKMRWKHGK